MTTPPLDGTKWMWHKLGPHYFDFTLQDGKLMLEPRNGGELKRAVTTIAELRAKPNEYIEIPPDGRQTMTTLPLDGTTWYYEGDGNGTDYVMKNGMVMFIPGAGGEPRPSVHTVADLRSRANYEERPPKKVTPLFKKASKEA